LAGDVVFIGEMRNAYKILVGKAGDERPLERPKRRWENNIPMQLKMSVCEDAGYIHPAEDTEQFWILVNPVMNVRFS
jgi:hypothetical protein